MSRTNPGDVIMDMLRSARNRQRSVRSLIDTGNLFGYTENTIRVNLSRLSARGLIESPDRGMYRLARQTDALNDFVERWRLGEERVRAWEQGEWLLAHPEAPGKATLWALDALGFRCVRNGLYARPDNLHLAFDALRELAGSIGLNDDVLVLQANAVDETTSARWFSVWHPAELDERYRDGLQRLQNSAARLNDLPVDEARLESFTLGGEMIHLLAKDPLLPAGQVDTDARSALWRAMLEYDVLGKEVWAGDKEENLRHMPRPQMTAAS